MLLLLIHIATVRVRDVASNYCVLRSLLFCLSFQIYLLRTDGTRHKKQSKVRVKINYHLKREVTKSCFTYLHHVSV